MPLPVFDKQEDIPEAFRPEYEEKDGKWLPKKQPAPDLESALKKERDAREEEERKRKEAEAKATRLEREKKATATGATDEQLEDLRKKDEEARRPLLEQNEKLKAENDKLRRLDKVRAEYLKHDGMADRVDDAMDQLDKRTRLGDTGQIVVLDKEGKDTTETLETFLKETFKKEKPWFYSGPGSSGSAAEGSKGGNGQGTYDPVAEGKKAAEEQKKGNAEKALAFK